MSPYKTIYSTLNVQYYEFIKIELVTMYLDSKINQFMCVTRSTRERWLLHMELH